METNRLPKQTLQYKPKGRRNIGDRRRDGGTNFILRIKEQETHLTLQEHDDDDVCLLSQAFLPGNSLEPAVIPTAQASSFTLQYFPYYV